MTKYIFHVNRRIDIPDFLLFLPTAPHAHAYVSTFPLFLLHPSSIFLPLLISIQYNYILHMLSNYITRELDERSSCIGFYHTLICIFLRRHSCSVKISRTFNFNCCWNSSDCSYCCSYFP